MSFASPLPWLKRFWNSSGGASLNPIAALFAFKVWWRGQRVNAVQMQCLEYSPPRLSHSSMTPPLCPFALFSHPCPAQLPCAPIHTSTPEQLLQDGLLPCGTPASSQLPRHVSNRRLQPQPRQPPTVGGRGGGPPCERPSRQALGVGAGAVGVQLQNNVRSDVQTTEILDSTKEQQPTSASGSPPLTLV